MVLWTKNDFGKSFWVQIKAREHGPSGLMEGGKEELEEQGSTTQKLYIIGNLKEAPELQEPSSILTAECDNWMSSNDAISTI